MVQGMSRDASYEFSKTILVRYVLSYLCGTLYLDPSTSLKRIFAFSVGGLFTLSTHALTCLRIKSHSCLVTTLPANVKLEGSGKRGWEGGGNLGPVFALVEAFKH